MDLNVDQLFTADSLLTLQGAAAVTYLVPNVLGAIIPMPDRVRALIALLIALGLSFYAASLGQSEGVITWVVALLNGFLIAGSALGFNQITGGRAPRPQGEPTVAAPAPAAPVPAPAAPVPAPAGEPGGADRWSAPGGPASPAGAPPVPPPAPA
ncbi:MAG: hypothetical protein IRY85_19935, partial [Micromonosporaceae bacterium]|nr:hypothetical protein [Micromonosporaceae bacterium]